MRNTLFPSLLPILANINLFHFCSGRWKRAFPIPRSSPSPPTHSISWARLSMFSGMFEPFVFIPWIASQYLLFERRIYKWDKLEQRLGPLCTVLSFGEELKVRCLWQIPLLHLQILIHRNHFKYKSICNMLSACHNFSMYHLYLTSSRHANQFIVSCNLLSDLSAQYSGFSLHSSYPVCPILLLCLKLIFITSDQFRMFFQCSLTLNISSWFCLIVSFLFRGKNSFSSVPLVWHTLWPGQLEVETAFRLPNPSACSHLMEAASSSS